MKAKFPYLTRLIKKLAPRVGASFFVEPEWGYAGQIKYPNGVVRSLLAYSIDLNHIGSADIAVDKGFAKFFMNKHGYPLAPGIAVFKDSWAKAIGSKKTASYAVSYAKKAGYPLIAKPNSKSQGTDVFLVANEKELRGALTKIFKNDRVALVEHYMPGHDYRVVVLDGEVISAYQRIALSVTGDGAHSVLQLLKAKQKHFKKIGRDTVINFKDVRIRLKLKQKGYSWRSILSKGEKVFLLDNANLSTGGDAVDVTQAIHKGFKKIAIQLTKDMGLRMAGVDIMVTNGNIAQAPNKSGYYILEINAAPGLDHYVTSGKKQEKIVEAMYLKVLKALGKRD